MEIISLFLSYGDALICNVDVLPNLLNSLPTRGLKVVFVVFNTATRELAVVAFGSIQNDNFFVLVENDKAESVAVNILDFRVFRPNGLRVHDAYFV